MVCLLQFDGIFQVWRRRRMGEAFLLLSYYAESSGRTGHEGRQAVNNRHS
jgi:hypothetical protein